MSESLANKYRPQCFEELVGQSYIVEILKKQIEKQQFKHAYLFTGPSGTGKTTIARILSKAINGNLNGVEDMDAASNNGVDNVRTLVRAAQERSVSSKYKIYIIDECHALTNQAWQAFLKSIEEPPEYTIYMFCTTNIEKVPDTIVNRCQVYNLSKISTEKIRDRLNYICEQEGYTNYQESTDYIAKISNGGARDAIATLEKVASFNTCFSIQDTLNILGNYPYDIMFSLANSIIDSNSVNVVRIVTDIYSQGQDLRNFVDSFFEFCLDVTKYCLFHSMDVLQIPASQEDALKSATNFDNAEKYYMYIVDMLMKLKIQLKNENAVKNVVEASFLSLSRWS